MKTEHLIQAIRNLAPNSEFSFHDNDYSTITWDILEGKAPTKAQVEAEVAKLETAEIASDESKAASRSALLDRLGISDEEAKLLFA